MALRRLTTISSLAAVALMGACAAYAEEPHAASFYKGKTISIIVGFGPGGGYDLYARLLARHLGEHIPGDPTVVVQNMEGAGGVRAANYVYATAPKDGAVIAGVNQGAALFQMLGGKGAQYNPVRFQWIGGVAHSNNTIYTSAASGIKTIDDAKIKEVSMAGSGVISDADIYPAVFNALVGTKFKVINGYTGTNDSNLAIERGEVAGRGGGAYSSLVSTKPDWLRDKKINILAQIGFEKEPDLPQVPLLLDLVKGTQAKAIATLVTLPTAIGYNYWLAPEVPQERIDILRKAFQATVTDPAMIAEAQREHLEVRPKSGEDLRDLVEKSAHEPKEILQRASKILGW